MRGKFRRLIMNAFAVLGLSQELCLSDQLIRETFRDAGKRVHPDAGGTDGEFAVLKDATAILSSPSRRLGHWMALRGMTVNSRGMIAPGLMDLFAKIGTVSQRADALIRKREAAQSALGRALLEPELQQSLQDVEGMISEVEEILSSECQIFEQWMIDPPTSEAGSEKMRNLAFLEKWKASLRSLYAKML